MTDEGFGGMRQRFETRQPKEAAGPLDGMHQPKDVAQDRLVVRIPLESDEFRVDRIEMLAGLDQELAQKIVHVDADSRNAAHHAPSIVDFGFQLIEGTA